MKMKVIAWGQAVPRSTMEADISGDVIFSEVFNGLSIVTEEDQRFGICQRGSGIEIVCPDGAMIEIKINEEGETYVVSHTCNRPKWPGPGK